MIYQTRGELDEAEALHRKSLALDEELGRKEGMASDYNNLGLIYQDRGELDEAEAMFRKALILFQQVGANPEVELVQRNLKALEKFPSQETKQ